MTWVDDYRFDEPFADVRDSPDIQRALSAELSCELGPSHLLHGTDWTFIARALPQDEVVVTTPTLVALVHLTWSGHEEA